MSWTDQSGNPECECGHLWSNHYNKVGMYFCEAPDCLCQSFNEITTADRIANSIFELEESEVMEAEEEEKDDYITGLRGDEDEIALDYDCERHGKGRGPDCPICFASDEKTRGRYMGGHDE